MAAIIYEANTMEAAILELAATMESDYDSTFEIDEYFRSIVSSSIELIRQTFVLNRQQELIIQVQDAIRNGQTFIVTIYPLITLPIGKETLFNTIK